jgi:hypothetical protein
MLTFSLTPARTRFLTAVRPPPALVSRNTLLVP